MEPVELELWKLCTRCTIYIEFCRISVDKLCEMWELGELAGWPHPGFLDCLLGLCETSEGVSWPFGPTQ